MRKRQDRLVSRSVDSSAPAYAAAELLPSWSSVSKLLRQRQPRPPPSRKQAARFVVQLTRPEEQEHCLGGQPWAPEMVWAAAAAEKAAQIIEAQYEKVIARDKSAALSRPSAASRAKTAAVAPTLGPMQLEATMEAQEPFPMPSRPASIAPSRPGTRAAAVAERPLRISSVVADQEAEAEAAALEVFKPHSPIAAEAAAALDTMARIGDRPFKRGPARPSTTSTGRPSRAPKGAIGGIEASIAPPPRPSSAGSTVGRKAVASAGGGAALSLPEMLLKIHSRTAALRAMEIAMLEDEMAGQTDDVLGLAVLPRGVAPVLGISGRQLAGGNKPYLDLDGIIAKLHRPPPLLDPPAEEVKKGPRKEYVLDGAHVPVRDTFDWSHSDLLICALDGDMDVVPLELTLLYKDIGKEENGGVDRTKFIKGLNLLLHLHNELRCPQHAHDLFWSAHAVSRPGTFLSIVLRLSALNSARCAVMALLRAVMGRATAADRLLAANERETQLQEEFLAQQLQLEQQQQKQASLQLLSLAEPSAANDSESPNSAASRPASRASSFSGRPRSSSSAAAADGKSRPTSAATVIGEAVNQTAPARPAQAKPASNPRLAHAHNIRSGAARAVEISRKLLLGESAPTATDADSVEPKGFDRAASPTRKERVARMLSEMDRDEQQSTTGGDAEKQQAEAAAAASAAAKSPTTNRGRGRREAGDISSLLSLTTSAVGVSSDEGAERSSSVKAGSVTSSSIAAAASAAAAAVATGIAAGPLSADSADSDRQMLVQALMDCYARAAPWPVAQLVFGNEVFLSRKYMTCV